MGNFLIGRSLGALLVRLLLLADGSNSRDASLEELHR